MLRLLCVPAILFGLASSALATHPAVVVRSFGYQPFAVQSFAVQPYYAQVQAFAAPVCQSYAQPFAVQSYGVQAFAVQPFAVRQRVAVVRPLRVFAPRVQVQRTVIRTRGF